MDIIKPTSTLLILGIFLVVLIGIILFMGIKILYHVSRKKYSIVLILFVILLYYLGFACGKTFILFYRTYSLSDSGDIIDPLEERYNEGIEYEKHLEYFKAMECFIDTYNYKDSAERFEMCSKLRLLEEEKNHDN